MARPPRLYAGDMHGAAQVVAVLWLGEPAAGSRPCLQLCKPAPNSNTGDSGYAGRRCSRWATISCLLCVNLGHAAGRFRRGSRGAGEQQLTAAGRHARAEEGSGEARYRTALRADEPCSTQAPLKSRHPHLNAGGCIGAGIPSNEPSHKRLEVRPQKRQRRSVGPQTELNKHCNPLGGASQAARSRT
jgi:hypothetical protein